MGELFIATIAKSGGEMRGPQVKAAQKEREDMLAVQLIALLKRYVFGDEEGFLVRAHALSFNGFLRLRPDSLEKPHKNISSKSSTQLSASP